MLSAPVNAKPAATKQSAFHAKTDLHLIPTIIPAHRNAKMANTHNIEDADSDAKNAILSVVLALEEAIDSVQLANPTIIC